MADLISKIKGVDNVTYDLQDKVSIFGGTNYALNSGDLTKWAKESGITVAWDSTKNMYKITDSAHSSSRWGIYQNITVKPNTTYTCSMEGLINDRPAYLAVGDGTSWPANRCTYTTTKQKLSYTWTTGTDITEARIYITFSPDATNQYFWALQPKLEKGTKPTEWTPAPQDLVTYSSETLEFFQ